MLFAESPRVIYERNPLTSVICQVRFPPILRINAEQPAQFQESIRAGFPRYANRQAEIPGLPQDIGSLVSGMGLVGFPGSSPVHEFATVDKRYIITLEAESLSLTTTDYKQWERFREHMLNALETLQAVYTPSFFVRIGLRYQDTIRRSILGLEGVAWGELIRPELLGILADKTVEDSLRNSFAVLTVALPEGKSSHDSQVTLRHGIAISDNEISYVIDSDFYIENQEVDTQYALATLNEFNRYARNLFRGCISERLHNAMEPTNIGEPFGQG